MLFCDAQGQISATPPTVSFLDHGFLFGDSLYEVVRLYDGKFFGWNEHLGRLIASAERVRLPIGPLLPMLKERSIHLVKSLNERNAVVRMVISRGVGKLHIDPRSCGTPLVNLAAWAFDEALYSQRPRLAVVSIRRNARSTMDPAIKSGNYLNNVMAFHEAALWGYDDAILLNPWDQVAELTTSNLGWIKNGEIHTPHCDSGILHGITRKFLLENFPVKEGFYMESDLRLADEVFVLSTLKEVLPVREIRFGDGTVQAYPQTPVTDRLRLDFRDKVSKRLARETNVFELS